LRLLYLTLAITLFGILVNAPLSVNAQTPGDVTKLVDSTAKTAPPINLKPLQPKEKRFWRAAYQLGLAQVVPWSYNRFIANVDYARITGESVKYNLSPSHWTFDKDIFQTNQFGHPYQGSLYFSAFVPMAIAFGNLPRRQLPAVICGKPLARRDRPHLMILLTPALAV
jgi:hypothetical protein